MPASTSMGTTLRRFKIAFEEALEFWIFLEVTVDDAFILVPPEFLEKKRFPRLSGTS